MKKNIVLIPAAGVGKRFAHTLPKQYYIIQDKTVLEHSLFRLARCPKIDLLVLLLAADDDYFQLAMLPDNCLYYPTTNNILPRDKQHCPILVCRIGGQSRAETVLNGLNFLEQHQLAKHNDHLLVHDAARCCISTAAIERLIEQAGNHADGGILAIPVTDTIKRTDKELISNTENRDNLWRAQTPQLFPFALLQKALQRANLATITDESSAVEQLGLQPLIVYGEISNIKLTQAEDIALINFYLTELQEQQS